VSLREPVTFSGPVSATEVFLAGVAVFLCLRSTREDLKVLRASESHDLKNAQYLPTWAYDTHPAPISHLLKEGEENTDPAAIEISAGFEIEKDACGVRSESIGRLFGEHWAGRMVNLTHHSEDGRTAQ
jgi:hypothetical protein